jgi:anti-anti-sigma factor
MGLRVQTEISGDVSILRCDGRISFEDDCSVLREKAENMLSGTPKIVVNLKGVDYVDSEGVGMLNTTS